MRHHCLSLSKKRNLPLTKSNDLVVFSHVGWFNQTDLPLRLKERTKSKKSIMFTCQRRKIAECQWCELRLVVELLQTMFEASAQRKWLYSCHSSDFLFEAEDTVRHTETSDTDRAIRLTEACSSKVLEPHVAFLCCVCRLLQQSWNRLQHFQLNVW